MLKTAAAKTRAMSYEKQNPREIKPFTREAAKSVCAAPVKMK